MTTKELQAELETIQLGDKRLNDRARKLLESFYADPQASINAAAHGWKESIAAYRFFDNNNVKPDEILKPHQQATIERVRQHPVALIVQDTTELDFSDHPPEGAGPLTSEDRLGFLDHTQMAFTPEGLCLGTVDVKIWARSLEGFGQAKKRQYDPIETKETFRWIEFYRRACDVAQQTPDTQIISVADREGDIYELFVEAAGRGESAAEYVIRAGKNRSLPEKDPEAEGDAYCKLKPEVRKAPVLATRQLELPRTPKREARVATLEVRAKRIRLKAPFRKHVSLPEVEINVVLVREVDPPSEEDAIEWLLVTSLPIGTSEEVLRVVDYYTGRWPIEIFFRVLKTGCQVERIRLETAERLQRCLMLYQMVAWRVLYLTTLGRECPDLACDVLFTEDEWKPVWKICSEDPIPETAPRLDAFLLLLARLGGHNGRTRDGSPGPQSLWVGIRRMTDFALAWRAFGPENHSKSPTKELVCN